jgi:hypothetical protein
VEKAYCRLDIPVRGQQFYLNVHYWTKEAIVDWWIPDKKKKKEYIRVNTPGRSGGKKWAYTNKMERKKNISRH